MLRVVIVLLMALPLLVPAGYCSCHLHAAECAVVDHENEPCDHHDEHDSDCPCKSVDHGIRGIVDTSAPGVPGPDVAAFNLTFEPLTLAIAIAAADRDRVPISTSQPRFVLFLSLLI